MAFTALTKLKQHNKRIKNLCPLIERYQQMGFYLSDTVARFEKQLLNHVYAVNDDDNSAFFNGKSLEEVIALGWPYILELNNEFAEHRPIYNILASYVLAPMDQASCLATLKAQPEHNLELISSDAAHWQVELATAHKNAVLQSPEHYGAYAKCMLFSCPVTELDIKQSHASGDFDMYYAALVSAHCQSLEKLQDYLFHGFSQTDCPEQQSEILALAGLGHDPRWYDVLFSFCTNNPGYTSYVLSHFYHKAALKVMVSLFEVPQCQDAAYDAWLVLTDESLAKVPALEDVDNKDRHSPHLCISEYDAERVRQELIMQPGDYLMGGVSFSKQTKARALRSYGGKLVQRAMANELALSLGMAAFFAPLSTLQWQRMRQPSQQPSTSEKATDHA